LKRLEITTRVAAPAERVWDRVTSEEGINYELRPWMRMTMPKQMRDKTIDDVAPGQELGRAWILLFGVLPFDYDRLKLAELEPGHRFLERSEMLSMRTWEHERIVEPQGAECTVTDRIGFELRRPLAALGLERPLRASLARMFAHRHRRLAGHFRR
jgi:ligand-binding SRPBCC domain-containing protein